MTIQAKARNLFKAVKGKYSDPNVKFLAEWLYDVASL
jgi:hypothetical protein